MRVAFVGSRNWTDKEKIKEVVEKYKKIAEKNDDILTVVSGGAQGADSLSVEAAKELGCNTLVFNAKWQVWGKAAGLIRNQEMLDDGDPEVVCAFRKGTKSVGTDDMLEKARKRKIPIELYTS